jgi:hypothetical protein
MNKWINEWLTYVNNDSNHGDGNYDNTVRKRQKVQPSLIDIRQ